MGKTTDKMRKWRRAVLAASLMAAPITYIVVRSHILLGRTAELIAVSDKFPRKYDVGDRSLNPMMYIALGDSTAAGVGVSRIEETYPYLVAKALARSRGRCVHVVNLAKSGARIEDVEALQLPALKDRRPDLITMSIGANDATHRTNELYFQSFYESVLNSLDAPEILIASTPDMACAPAIQPFYGNFAGARAQDQNRWLKLYTRNSHVKLVDIFSEGKLDYNKDSGLYASDRFHPSAKGYAVWAELFVKNLQ
jgi:lysophospholipase L1-like esterase